MRIRIIRTSILEYEPDVNNYNETTMEGIALTDIRSCYVDDSVDNPFDNVNVHEYYEVQDASVAYDYRGNPIDQYHYEELK